MTAFSEISYPIHIASSYKFCSTLRLFQSIKIDRRRSACPIKPLLGIRCLYDMPYARRVYPQMQIYANVQQQSEHTEVLKGMGIPCNWRFVLLSNFCQYRKTSHHTQMLSTNMVANLNTPENFKV